MIFTWNRFVRILISDKIEIMWHKKILPYFHYNKKERAGIIALLVVVVLLWAIPFFFAELSENKFEPDITLIPAALHKLEEQRRANNETDSAVNVFVSYNHSKPGGSNINMSAFDPNTTSPDEWSAMGIKPRTVEIIQNYLAKGGRFHKNEDLQKVYGLKSADYKRLAPFIRINNAVNTNDVKRGAERKPKYDSSLRTKPYSQKIDINTADMAAWESLPGIGEKLATRIILFREKLGGFARIDQVAETYGIEPDVFDKIAPRLVNDHATSIKKVALNTGSFDELKQHPYVGYRLAKLLVAYREQHGEYRKMEDLMNIPLFTNEVAAKLSPYLEW